ncbi:group 1 truncated hemoglobin [Thermomonas sp.]|uniref:group I truncated hemoglobin n=1 Tax=Thermomonas sp. TaxID=1971895 RepID=UPI002487AEA4|nr:group 1 truncated hemoglobin [Thermomonas sp.]MDI1252994.1 group 1 truncated hemoglobin [Thermomonas sp.]
MNLKQTLIASSFMLLACLPFAAFAQDAHTNTDANDAMPMETTARLDPTAPNPAPPHPELAGVLLHDFGGKAGLTTIVGTFMDNMMADPRTQPFFANVDRERVKRELTEQFCVILGGDCVYTGRDMRTTHAGLKIDRNNFNALVEDLQLAMDTHKVPFRSQNKLLAILAPMHREAITK